MKTVYDRQSISTTLTVTDRKVLSRIVGTFSKLQVRVMGSARHLERIHENAVLRRDFDERVSFGVATRKRRSLSYLSDTLREFSATRFPLRAADFLERTLKSQTVFQNGKVVLFEGLSHIATTNELRDEMVRRCPIFRLKSASDFMITVGLSHDVIALDTRVVGVFQKDFDYNFATERIQSQRNLYLSLEVALREFCAAQSIPLALLDRILFQFSNMSA